MPTIPQIQRRVSPSATGAFQLRQKDTQVASATNQLSGTIQQAAQAIQVIKEKADKIVDTRQMTQAMLDVQKLTSKFHVDMSENTDTANSKNIIEGYQNGVRELLGGVDNKRIKDELYGKATSMSLSAIGTEELRDVARNKDATNANYEASLSNLLHMSSLAGNEADLVEATSLHMDIFNDVADLNGWSAEQKEAQLRKVNSQVRKEHLSGLISKDPETALIAIESAEDLAPTEKETLKDRAKKAIESRKTELEIRNMATNVGVRNELSTMMVEGNFDPIAINSMRSLYPGVDSKVFDDAIKYYETERALSGNYNPANIANIYSQLALVKTGKSPKINKKNANDITNVTANAWEHLMNGRITQAEYNAISKKIEDIFIKDDDSTQKIKQLQSWVRNGTIHVDTIRNAMQRAGLSMDEGTAAGLITAAIQSSNLDTPASFQEVMRMQNEHYARTITLNDPMVYELGEGKEKRMFVTVMGNVHECKPSLNGPVFDTSKIVGQFKELEASRLAEIKDEEDRAMRRAMETSTKSITSKLAVRV